MIPIGKQTKNQINNNEKGQIKTAVYINEFINVSTSTNVAFKTMFPNLSLDKVVCFNIEIVNVYEHGIGPMLIFYINRKPQRVEELENYK